MKSLKLFLALAIMLTFFSCSTDGYETDNLSDNTSIETRSLGCIANCNYALANCLGGQAGVGESYADFYEYYLCRCVEGQEDCVWMGSNTNDPSDLTCNQLLELHVGWREQCYISYSLCIGECDVDLPGNENDDINNDGIVNWQDIDLDGDGIPDYLDPSVGSGSTTSGGSGSSNSGGGSGSTTNPNNNNCGGNGPCPPGMICVKGTCKMP